jgi:sec-independent protein translocase protein TatB
MFEVGWTEMLVIAIVMIVVVGPKDLPGMLRTFGRFAAKARAMAGDFQKQFNEALKEAELDDVKKSVDSLRGLNPMNEIRKQLNPFEQAAADVKSGIENTMRPKPAPEPTVEASNASALPAEPLKTGATDMPGEPTPAATSSAAASSAANVARTATRAAKAPAKAKATSAASAGSAPAKATTAQATAAKASASKAAASRSTAKSTARSTAASASAEPQPAVKPKAAPKAVSKAPASTGKPAAAAKPAPAKTAAAKKTAGAAK